MKRFNEDNKEEELFFPFQELELVYHILSFYIEQINYNLTEGGQINLFLTLQDKRLNQFRNKLCLSSINTIFRKKFQNEFENNDYLISWFKEMIIISTTIVMKTTTENSIIDDLKNHTYILRCVANINERYFNIISYIFKQTINDMLFKFISNRYTLQKMMVFSTMDTDDDKLIYAGIGNSWYNINYNRDNIYSKAITFICDKSNYVKFTDHDKLSLFIFFMNYIQYFGTLYNFTINKASNKSYYKDLYIYDPPIINDDILLENSNHNKYIANMCYDSKKIIKIDIRYLKSIDDNSSKNNEIYVINKPSIIDGQVTDNMDKKEIINYWIKLKEKIYNFKENILFYYDKIK